MNSFKDHYNNNIQEEGVRDFLKRAAFAGGLALATPFTGKSQTVSLPQTTQQTSPRELETVIACLILEAGGEGKVGMEAVNEVIQNRAKVQRKSPYQVATAPKQFSCFNAGVDRGIEKAKKHSRWKLAEQIVKAPKTNHTKGATFYHTTNIMPKWAKTFLNRGAKTVKIGNHVFYYGVK